MPASCLCSVSPQTRKTAAWLAGRMAAEGHQVALLSGELAVEQRAAVIQRFREGKEKVLITTNVCSRGEYTVTRFQCATASWVIFILTFFQTY